MAPATELGFEVPDTRNVSMTTPPQQQVSSTTDSYSLDTNRR
jgi:hypothetical protein